MHTVKTFVIPPHSHLELMHEGTMGYFCLAQHYYANAAYRKFFKARKAEGKWILLDNGAGDHALITEDILIECAKDLMPNEIVPPDVLFDSVKTLENLISFMTRMNKEGLSDKIEIFAVPQGKTAEEWLDCYEAMLNTPSVKTIGLSKLGAPKAFLGQAKDDQGIMEARHICVDTLVKNNLLKKPIHLLGMGDPTEYKKYRAINISLGKTIFRSTDSCNSVWSAMNGIAWNDGNFKRIVTPKDYFDRHMSAGDITLAKQNIKYFKELLA